MSELSHSSAEFFEAKYQQNHDPWDFENNEYERSRYSSILEALEDSHWRSGLEPGCSVGVLTEALASRCDRLSAFDLSPTATQIARERCRQLSHVEISCSGLCEVGFFGDYDLIVLSEIGYYFAETEWKNLLTRMIAEIKAGTTILAAHWTGESKDHALSGDRVHEILLTFNNLKLAHSERHTRFRLEKWERA